jgi:uncharacterized membrane protein (UPF0182 family)
VASGRSRTLLLTVAILGALFIGVSAFSAFWTERLWFGSIGFTDVFSTIWLTRVALFLVFGGLMAGGVALCMALAYRFRPMLFPGVNAPDDGMDRYRQSISPVIGWLVGGISALMGLAAGFSAAGQWRNFLQWRNGGEFGSKDPFFDKDFGFYIFDLPFWHYVVDFAMTLAVVGLMATLVVHYVFGGIRLSARSGERFSSAAQVQVSVLLALFAIAKAVDYWLDRYGLVLDSTNGFTGMGHTEERTVLPGKEILAGIAIVCAIIFLANVWRRTWMLPSLGVALFVLSTIILGMIVPGVVQQFQVNPNVPDKQGPYIAKNISATRAAYGLDQVEVTSYNSDPDMDNAEVDELDGLTASVPLVDPKIVSRTFQQEQQVRGYYSVSDVLDVDRYDIDGQDRALVLGVRELDQNGIEAGDRSWANLHTVYTHGNGVIAAFANQRPSNNIRQASSVQWAEGREANARYLTDLSEEGYETRVYFGEQSPVYSIVGKAEDGADVELDLPSTAGEEDESRTTSYDGEGGVDIGSTLRKAMFAMRFGEINLLLSDRVHDNSRILFDRDPRQRVEKVAPWLTVDSDPYPAVIDGRIQWILDGYTVTDRYPLSQRGSLEEMTDDSLQDDIGFQTLPTDEINYIRNAVKATVDAYDGTVTLYEWDESDPILKTWMKTFPDTVQPRSEIPDSLMQHLRYPDDLFKVQRYQYQRYHEEDPQAWYAGSNRWEVPRDPEATASLQPPYRLFTNAGDGDTWSLTSVYVPRGRENLAAYVWVDSDATSDDYGKLQVLELPKEQIEGPKQMVNVMASDEKVRDVLFRFTQGNVKLIYGNLLTMPVGDGLMYVQPIYSQRDDQETSFPILSFVRVSYGDKVGIGETMRGAIANALGVDDEGPATTPPDGGGGNNGDPDNGEQEPETDPDARIRSLLAQAEEKFVEADQAQRNGNTVRWARLMDEARDLIDQAIQLAE